MEETNTFKLKQKYNKLLEKKENIEDYEEWSKNLHKNYNKAFLIILGISTIITIPFILDICGKISANAIIGGELLKLAIFGGIGISVSGITLIGGIPLFGILKLCNKTLAKTNEKSINKIKKQLGRKKETTPKKESQPTSSYNSTAKTIPKKEFNNNSIKKISKESPKYSYKPTNNEEKFDPSKYIKIIDGKAVWTGPSASDTKTKTLSKK